MADVIDNSITAGATTGPYRLSRQPGSAGFAGGTSFSKPTCPVRRAFSGAVKNNWPASQVKMCSEMDAEGSPNEDRHFHALLYTITPVRLPPRRLPPRRAETAVSTAIFTPRIKIVPLRHCYVPGLFPFSGQTHRRHVIIGSSALARPARHQVTIWRGHMNSPHHSTSPGWTSDTLDSLTGNMTSSSCRTRTRQAPPVAQSHPAGPPDTTDQSYRLSCVLVGFLSARGSL